MSYHTHAPSNGTLSWLARELIKTHIEFLMNSLGSSFLSFASRIGVFNSDHPWPPDMVVLRQ